MPPSSEDTQPIAEMDPAAMRGSESPTASQEIRTAGDAPVTAEQPTPGQTGADLPAAEQATGEMAPPSVDTAEDAAAEQVQATPTPAPAPAAPAPAAAAGPAASDESRPSSLTIKKINAMTLPDATRLCLAGQHTGDRPRAFTKDVELDCNRNKLSALRESWLEGARAYAAYRHGMLVGYLELAPIARALVPVDGENAYVVQCLRVPEPAERAEVEKALVDHAVELWGKSSGVAVLAREKDWSAHGFEQIDAAAEAYMGDERVLWWRAGEGGGEAPKIVPVQRSFPRFGEKVRVDIFFSDRCPWDYYIFDMLRGICARMTDTVQLFETDCNQRRELMRAGVSAGIAVNGKFMPWLRPHHLPDEHMIRRELETAG